jgi:hypothetical protein
MVSFVADARVDEELRPRPACEARARLRCSQAAGPAMLAGSKGELQRSCACPEGPRGSVLRNASNRLLDELFIWRPVAGRLFGTNSH